MRKTVHLAFLFAFPGLLLLADISSAHAQAFWGMPASTCVPDETSAAKYDVTSHAVNFRAGQTGDIHLHCPVNSFLVFEPFSNPPPSGFYYWPTATAFTFTSSGDGDGTGLGHYVEVQLRTANEGWTSRCTVTSQNAAFTQRTCNFTDFVLDPDSGHVFFYVRLHRANTSFNPTFYGVRLQ